MTLPYETGFPTADDSLGSTRAKFFGNTQSVKTFLDVNHYDFGNVLYGNHKWVMYGRQTGNFPDTSSPSNQAIATYGSSDGTRTQLWFQPSNDATGASAIQLTAGDVTSATFSKFIAYGTPPADKTQFGGWTFLPGGLIAQYGKFTSTGGSTSSGVIEFPIPWGAGPLIYNIQLTIARTSARVASVSTTTPPTTTEFTFLLDASFEVGEVIHWYAIGKL